METLKKLLKQLPPVPKRPTLGETPRVIDLASQVRCQGCNAVIPATETEKKTDSGERYFDVLCRSCEKAYSGTAKLVCVQCRQVVARLKPKKLESGFVIEAGKVYHTDSCSVCEPGIEKSVCLEIAAYEAVTRPANRT